MRDILAAVGEPVLSSRWRCRDLCYTAVREGKFTEIREARRKFSGEEMMQFAGSIHQTIDGRFEARGGGAAKMPWLVVLAVDSGWFEVWSSKGEVLERVRARFEKVSDLPAAAEAFATSVKEKVLPFDCKLRRVKYLNNVIEQDHRAIRRRWRAAQCFRSLHSAERTLEGVEALHMMRKGQVKRLDGRDAVGQAKFVESLFGVAA